MRIAVAAMAAVLCSCGGSGDDGPDDPLPADLAMWERFEATLDRPVVEDNPFDPAQVSVSAEFRSPQGSVYGVDGFVFRDYARELRDGRERLHPVGELQWKIRFTPAAAGVWEWRWRVVTPAGIDESAWMTLRVAASTGARGFVRRSPDPRYLVFDDGSPYWAVGENMAWYDSRGTFSYDVWMSRLAEQGGNYVRLWMPSWAFGLEWISRNAQGEVVASTLGNYTARLDRAWQLDYVIDLAGRLGITVMLSLQNHGAFSLVANSEWADSPYNAANGGPLGHPRDFFTDPAARALFERRLRYIVARWGYAPSIMAWELWNEVDLVEQPAPQEVVAWHRDMAAEIRRRDPYGRLISTSIASGVVTGSPLAALWNLDDIDFTQIHLYSFEGANTDFTDVLPRVAARLHRIGKPVLIAEAGVDFRGPAEELRADPEGHGFHDILWAGLIAETFGSGMVWWWDNLRDPADQYFYFGPLAAFTAGVDFPAEGFVTEAQAVAAPDGRQLRVHLLKGRRTVLGWIKNAAHQYYAPDLEPVAGAHVSLHGLGESSWSATWVDTRTGATTDRGDVEPLGGGASLEIPTFTADIALRLQRK